MQKAKDILWRITITAIIWIISRFIPTFLQRLIPMNTLVSALVLIGTLYLGWYIVGSMSEWKYPTTIAMNLITFCAIEAFGCILILLALLKNFSLDALEVVLVFLIDGIYIWLCFVLKDETEAKHNALYGSNKS